MQVRIWLASLPPPIASKAMVAPVSTSACVRSSMKVAAVESTTCLAPMPRSSLACSALRTMLTRPMPSSLADLVQHLAEVGRGRGMHQRLVALALHGLGHAERGQRIDEPRSALGRRRAGRQRLAVGRLQEPVLRVHRAADHRHRLAQQRLRRLRRARLDHRARALVADRHRLVEARGDEGQRLLRHLGRDLDGGAAARGLGRAMSAGPSSRPRSDGLIGVASTLTTTWSGPGSGIGTSASDSSSSPLFLIRERSCSPWSWWRRSCSISCDRWLIALLAHSPSGTLCSG